MLLNCWLIFLKLFDNIFLKFFVTISSKSQTFWKLSSLLNQNVIPPFITSLFISTVRKEFLFPEISKLTLFKKKENTPLCMVLQTYRSSMGEHFFKYRRLLKGENILPKGDIMNGLGIRVRKHTCFSFQKRECCH